MPIRTEYTADGKGALQVATGSVTATELAAELRVQCHNPARPPDLDYVLVDFTSATGAAGTLGEIGGIVSEQRELARYSPNVAIAIIAPSDLVYGLARMWEGMAHGLGWDGVVVRTRPEALAWLREKRAKVAIV